MKKIKFFSLAILALILFQGPFCFSQISVGAKAGANISNLSNVDDIQGFESDALWGFHLGGYVTFNLGRNFAIQPEVMYSSQGAKLSNATMEDNLNLNYINVPVMIKFLTNKGFYVEAGPQIGFRAGEVSGDFSNLEQDINDTDASACIGLGWQPTKNPFGIGARYNIGLGKVSDLETLTQDDVNVKSGVFQLSLYLRLFGGGKLKD